MARRPRATFTKPMHPAPHRAMPASAAIAASRDRSPVPPGGSTAPPKITAERAWFRAAATRAGAGPDQRHAPGLEHRGDRAAGLAASGGGAYLGWRGHFRRTVARRSAIAALAACMPGMPQTPPPAWVAELA